ncbi:NAD(+)/NADH kinase [Clostridium botulinum]|uniref:NAD(+)/NADH kinase n=1 Tax=Clostridium TaxID=1485 RepID=UPI00050765B0|nr:MULTISPECIES: NAD(+)/NADH kinase [unclassified Clostridium]AIY78849.1 ATP-NAD kinase family protein [Clostridium botulinum 202F]KAI3346928.1 NAD(+)/NADH kinase [Clostridium botulinum]KFX55536.1 inorganic polyphosphate kinase [Clostridium botulinum]KFX55776.1 inorganic polyphosphate kinase [Clostridium botulinum]KON13726.1 inorganic polyphosphate kinase [Clostridium botulinum]
MKNIGIAINPSKDYKNTILNMVKEKIKNICNITDIEVYNSFDIKNLNLSSLDLLIVLGGDGTLLGVARELDDDFKAPILGINIGNLGVLSSIEISDLELALKKLMTKDCKVHKRMMLNCEVDINESIKNIKALNEVAVARGTLSRMVKFKIFVDEKLYAIFKGDGLIVSTPTGSTAYSFSAGGPFICPDLEVISIVPICDHTKSMHPIVLKGDSTIKIIAQNGGDQIYLTIDGQRAIEMKDNSVITVKKNPKSLKLLLFNDYDYFKVIRNKVLNNSKECDGEEI